MTIVKFDTKDLISYAEAARILKVSRPSIYNYIKRYGLHPVEIGGNQYLLKKEIEQVKKERV